MKIKILIDNKSDGKLLKEWGLSVHVEYCGKHYLLDTGHSSKFYKNSVSMNVDVSKVDYGILSHAHYDHSDGLKTFFRKNEIAKFYIQDSVDENCYHTHKFFHVYIGIRKGWLKKFSDRFIRAKGISCIAEGVYLVPHSTPSLEKKGLAAHLSIKKNGKYEPDNFEHEQSLVFDTENGLVVMNSCSHAGADNIISEICNAFPGKKIHALLGGFHLFCLADDDVRSLAERLRNLDVQKIYTGHCTGDRAFAILRDVLGDKVEQIYSGMNIEI